MPGKYEEMKVITSFICLYITGTFFVLENRIILQKNLNCISNEMVIETIGENGLKA